MGHIRAQFLMKFPTQDTSSATTAMDGESGLNKVKDGRRRQINIFIYFYYQADK